jgi:hypothetical protein
MVASLLFFGVVRCGLRARQRCAARGGCSSSRKKLRMRRVVQSAAARSSVSFSTSCAVGARAGSCAAGANGFLHRRLLLLLTGLKLTHDKAPSR